MQRSKNQEVLTFSVRVQTDDYDEACRLIAPLKWSPNFYCGLAIRTLNKIINETKLDIKGLPEEVRVLRIVNEKK